MAELLAMKGKRQIVLTTAFDEWTARAAEQVFLAGGFALPEAGSSDPIVKGTSLEVVQG